MECMGPRRGPACPFQYRYMPVHLSPSIGFRLGFQILNTVLLSGSAFMHAVLTSLYQVSDGPQAQSNGIPEFSWSTAGMPYLRQSEPTGSPGNNKVKPNKGGVCMGNNGSCFCAGYGPEADLLFTEAQFKGRRAAHNSKALLALLGNHPELLTCRSGLPSNECSIWHLASKAGKIGLLRCFLEFSRSEVSPFAALPAEQRDAKIRRLLDAKDGKGQTPLHMAAERGHIQCVELLVEMVSVYFEGAGYTCMHVTVPAQ